MTYFERLTASFLICLAFTVVSPSVLFGQSAIEKAADLLQEEFALNAEDAFGSMEAEEETALARLVDKSTIADLGFLNSGESPSSIDQLKAMQDHVADLYDRIEPAVVNIQSNMGQGSGVVISSDGYILTAAHVISIPNRSAIITFPDGKRARAQTLGIFRDFDAGLLKIYSLIPDADEDDEESTEEESESEEKPSEDDSESDEKGESEPENEEGSGTKDSADEDSDDEESDDDESDDKESDDEESKDEDSDAKDKDASDEPKKPKRDPFAAQEDLPSFRYLDVGDSSALNLGQWVVAVGHPGGIDKKRGIVLRVGRINELKLDPDESEIYVRTDCTLVGGDSGGPLIGMDGSVIGIHSRIGLKLRQNFHVPSNEFLANWTKLLQPVVHDGEPQMMLGFRSGTNVISSVPKNSRAARYGLKGGDRIIRVGEREVYDKLQFEDVMSTLKPYQKVEFEVLRKGKKRVLDVTIGEKRSRRGFR